MRIKELRLSKNLTQQDLAVVIGCNQTAIGKYERGQLEPNISILTTLADFFGVSVDYLIGREDDFGVINNLNVISDDEKELLGAYRTLSKQDKQKAITVIKTAFDK